MSRGAEVIVAGAGALGLSCALALADAGCRVTVCDPSPEGPSASRVAAGMLAPVFETVLDPGGGDHFELLLAARDLWPAFAERTGVALDRSGALAVGAADWLERIEGRLGALGLAAVELDRAGLDEAAPGLAGGFIRGLMTAEDWRLEAHSALGALRAAAAASGVAFRAEAVTGVGDADWVVAATGAGKALAGIAPELTLLSPIKGHILRYPEVRGGGVSVRTDGAYAAPSGAGLAVGATMEAGRSDTEVDPALLTPLAAAAGRLFPALAGAAFEGAAGVRMATPDGLPIAGASIEPKVLLASGARRNGWLVAPLVAQVVAAQITGQDPGPHAARLDPARF